ncbi:uncharacterized protein Z520_03407 [Fonsecaea multimorphosa CBS 102226]|uniref:NAD-dependent epimerase/dehydratase domain-containing protein n=1 Tax=Fonsecaea multimorphosa CBS 102226 TaxID=1442371 RepID=A0A0D2IUK8_9EURO|nr:uncharacterized protein Z520_03407 [Fonsecaea multimorphosa CBS 102226]KIY00742.1 hypothetical protein Z520_03407 [Fonsecaea multimorphosa CBS 102226]OAL27787.1 hypothetical protein AYO22_03329 [Fonsecaea multimorphosa]
MSSVPPGGLILVTGANSYVGSVAIQVFLQRDYRVRGTVRNVARHAWMTGHFGPRFELVEVSEISSPGAFDEAIKDVDGIAHLAMNMDMDPQNQAVIHDTIATNLHLLRSAAREPSVKSVVITSTSAACTLPTTGMPYKIDATTWNTAAIEHTSKPWNGEGNPRWHRILLYGAAKARGEQEAFAWVLQHKPRFSFNTVVPKVNFGTAVAPENMGYPRQILLKSVDERVVDADQVDNQRSVEVLKKMGKADGFTSVEDTLVKAVHTILENQCENVPKTRIDLFHESLASQSSDGT